MWPFTIVFASALVGTFLDRALPPDNEPARNHLRASARGVSVRLWAVGSPFDAKDLLKARGYRWNGGGHCGWCDVPEKTVDEELAWLGPTWARRCRATCRASGSAWSRWSRRVPEAPPR